MIGVKWIGWDGSEWNLQTGDVVMTKGGVVGLGHPDLEIFYQNTALSDGQRYMGYRAKPRTVLLPVLIGQSLNEEAWIATDNAWWRTMRPDKPGTLIVTAPNGTSRSIKLRFVDDGGMLFDHDPTADRLMPAVLNMVADDPWWVGTTFSRKFSAGDAPTDFFGGGTAPDFHISAASTLGSVQIENPGDVDAWGVFYIEGPATSFMVKIDGQPISSTEPVAANSQLQIETAPNRQVAYLVVGGEVNGETGFRYGGVRSNATRLLAEVNFAPIPADDGAVLDIALTGTGSVTLRADPRFFRAW